MFMCRITDFTILIIDCILLPCIELKYTYLDTGPKKPIYTTHTVNLLGDEKYLTRNSLFNYTKHTRGY